MLDGLPSGVNVHCYLDANVSIRSGHEPSVWETTSITPGVGRADPEEALGRYRKAMFRVRSSNEPLVILDSLAEMQEILHQIERAAVEEARAQGATWSQVAEALNRTRQAVEQRFGRALAGLAA